MQGHAPGPQRRGEQRRHQLRRQDGRVWLGRQHHPVCVLASVLKSVIPRPCGAVAESSETMMASLAGCRVWDLESGTCRSTLEGHTAYVNTIAISHDGKTIVSGSGDPFHADNTVRYVR